MRGRDGGGTSRSRGRENYNQDIVYEKRIHFQKKEKIIKECYMKLLPEEEVEEEQEEEKKEVV